MAVLAVVLPVIVAAASLARRRWFPARDYAFIVRHIADVGGRHTPLVGVYSRFGWDHPGPLLFWVLAPFQRLGGPTGVLVGTAAINVVCVAGALLVAYRRGGPAGLLWVGLCVAVLSRALGTAFLIDPWNPRLPVTGLVWFLLLTWSVSGGDTAMWPWLVGVGSWEVQTHIGFAPVVAVLFAFVVVCRVVASRRAKPPTAGEGSPGWRWAILVGLVLWAAPIVQQLTGHPGNLAAIVRFALHPSATTVGFANAVHIVAKQLTLPPPWITGHDTNFLGILESGPIWPGLAELLLLAGLGVLAWRRHQTEAALLAGLSLVAVVGGVAGVARIDGLPFPYLARWIWVVAMFVPLATVWCIASLLRPLAARSPGAELAVRPWLRTAGPAFLLAAIVAVVGVTTGAGAKPDLPAQMVSDGVAALAGPTQRALDRGRAYLVVSIESQVVGPGLGVGLQAELEARGYHVFFPPETAFQAGTWRTTRHHRTDATLSVVALGDTRTGLRIPADWRRVAHWDPLTPAERSTANSLEDTIRGVLGDRLAPTSAIAADGPFAYPQYVGHGVPAAIVRQLAALQRRGDGYDVFLHTGPYAPVDGPSAAPNRWPRRRG